MPLGKYTTKRRPMIYTSSRMKNTQQRIDQPGFPEVVVNSSVLTLKGAQETVSAGHRVRDLHKRVNDKGDVGGNFFTQKQYAILPDGSDIKLRLKEHTTFSGQPRVTEHRYDGPVLAFRPTHTTTGQPLWPPYGGSSDDDLIKWGTTAIAQCQPGNPPADLSTLLAELLREGLPSMIGATTLKSRIDASKKAGSEYLNVQFGWMPIVNEVRDLANSIAHAHSVITQYERDAGRNVRRRFGPHTEVEQDEIVIAKNIRPVGPTIGFLYKSSIPPGTVIRRRETVRKRWFSGAFTYYLPANYKARKQVEAMFAKAQHVLGLTELTPELVWNIAPWSWAVDWFSNAGDVLHNVSRYQKDGLVMHYGYVMETVTVSDTYTLSDAGLKSGHQALPVTLVSETKRRLQASPYGFGLTWEQLNAFQLSILAALGITKR